MGFGRIGRNLFRILYKNDDVRIVAVSDIADHASLEYLLKYDTIMGRFPDDVSVKDGNLYTYGRQTKMLSGRDPGDVDWKEHDVDIVIEATARDRSMAEMKKHVERGAKRVILCIPPSDPPDKTVVMGVNHRDLKPEHKIVSNASITAHCASPVVSLLDKAFGIERMYYTTIHAYSNDQRLADVPAEDLRRSRAAGENIIPLDTNSGKILEQLFPHLEGKISALALKVPVPNGSLVDMTMFMKNKVDKTAINEVMRTGIAAKYPDYVDFAEDPIVSSDVKRSPYSSTFDSLATTTLGDNAVKTIAWFDNGWGYAHRIVDLIRHFASMEGGV